MKMVMQWVFSWALFTSIGCLGDELLFQDNFRGKLGADWTWTREHREAWRITEKGLEVRVEPGNMWGPANNAKNILIRSAPEAIHDEIEVTVKFENRPTEQYEQADLVWYYDDSHMVKLGQELVDGKLSVVMGREEADRTRTIAILPLKTAVIELRLLVKGTRLRGQYRPAGVLNWQTAGECDLPAHGRAKISLQFYQGSAKVEHWVRINDFTIRQIAGKGKE